MISSTWKKWRMKHDKMHQLWSYSVRHTFLRWSEAQASFFLHRCASQHPHVCAIEAAPNQYNSHANLCQLMTSQLLVQKDLAILAKRKYLTRWLKITSEQSMSVGFLWWGRPRSQCSQNENSECCYDCFTFTPFAETFSGISTMRPFSIAANQ